MKCTFARDGADVAVECAQAVGTHQQEAVAKVVDVTNLGEETEKIDFVIT